MLRFARMLTILFPIVALTAPFSAPSAEELAVAIAAERSDPIFDAAKHFKAAVEKGTNGQYTVTLLGSEVGGERDQLEAAAIGEYAITVSGSMPITLYAPRFVASDLPFVFNSTEQAAKVYSGALGEALNAELLKTSHMRLVGVTARPPRNLTSNKPVLSPDDIQRVTLRVPEITSWVKVWSSLGATTSPIAWPEVYTALQTGVIKMQENPVDYIYAGKLYEVQKYINKTEHAYTFYHWMMSDKVLAKIPDQWRGVILKAAADSSAWGSDHLREGEAKYYKLLQDKGMQVVETDKESFRTKARPAVREIIKGLDPSVAAYIETLLH